MQGGLEWLIGSQQQIVHVEITSSGSDCFQKGFKFALVGGTKGARFRQLISLIFESLEECRINEGKILLDRVNDLHQHHVMTAMAEVFQSPHHGDRIIKKITENHHQSPPLNPLGQVMKNRANGRFSQRGTVFQVMTKLPEVCRSAAGADQLVHGGIKRGESHGVLLMNDQISERSGDVLSILTLGVGGFLRLVDHGLAGIDEQMTGKISLFFVLFEVDPVRLTKDFPVDIAEIIPRNVLTVLGKFDRESVKGAFVHPGHRAFDDHPGFQFQSFEFGQRRRIEKA